MNAVYVNVAGPLRLEQCLLPNLLPNLLEAPDPINPAGMRELFVQKLLQNYR